MCMNVYIGICNQFYNNVIYIVNFDEFIKNDILYEKFLKFISNFCRLI